MVLELSFAFPGDTAKQFRLALVRLGDFFKDPFVGLEADISDWFDELGQAHWASEGARGPGGLWPSWAPSTAARKKPGDKLMIVTGRLKGALTESSHPEALRHFTPRRVELGIRGLATRKYPIYHQAGAPASNLPQRRVVDMLKGKDDIALGKLVQSALVRRARAAGFIDGSRASGVSRAVR